MRTGADGLDLDRSPVDAPGEFDPILAFGVLYHLEQPAFFLRGCRKAMVLLLAGFDSVRDISNSLDNWSIGSFDWEARELREWQSEGANLRKTWVRERQGRDE